MSTLASPALRGYVKKDRNTYSIYNLDNPIYYVNVRWVNLDIHIK